MADEEKKEKALAELKAIYEDGCAEVNEREYKFTPFTHTQRRRVFAFYSSIGQAIGKADFSFLTTQEFAKVEKIIEERVLFEDMQLEKLDKHWEKYPQDYITFICAALGAISYPFLSGLRTS